MNDPRLTSYAVGELETPDREAFEKELAASAELQNELKEIIALAEQLPASFEPGEGLTDDQRRSLRARFVDHRRARTMRRNAALAGITALAASVVIAAMMLSASRESSWGVSGKQVASTGPAKDKENETTPASGTLATASSNPQIADARSTAKKSDDSSRVEPTETKSTAQLAMLSDNAMANQKPAPLAPAAEPAPVAAGSGQGAQIAAGEKLEQGGALASLEAPMDMLVSATPSARTAAPVSPEVAKPEVYFGVVAGVASEGIAGYDGSFKSGDRRSEVNHKQRDDSPDNEAYATIQTNPFLDAKNVPLSTFSIDVDTASYANVRRFLTDGNLPPPDAVRIEELVNYFRYDYPQPDGDAPFSVNTEISRAPWNADMLLARVALKGRDIAADKLPPSNLVFLVDVSGSMEPEDKLPLLKRSLSALVEKLSLQDHVAIVTYAGDSGVALRSTSGEDKARIQRAIKGLDAGGSTNGASGIDLAYEIARKNFIKEGNNRIILCTDGDFNVGVTSLDALTRLIEHERKSGVFLSVLGFGTGNLKDSTMEMLADKANGNYAYIDTPAEGRKVLVDQMRANLFTIAKDVKIQVEFNPATVAGYRLIGYENRLLAKEDFNNDKKDAGEIGAGHTVTALYEIVPAGKPFPSTVDALKYQTPAAESENPPEGRQGLSPVLSKIQNPKSLDLFTVKLRYKAPDGDKSKVIEKVVGPQSSEFEKATQDFRFASAVAAFGMKLRDNESDPTLDWSEIQTIARSALGNDPDAYRAEFLTLVQKAKQLSEAQE